MTMSNMRPAKAVGEQMVFAAGQFVVPATATSPNQQVIAANLPAGSIGTSQLTAVQTVSPQGTRMFAYANPDGSQAGAAVNQTAMPRGVATGITGTLGSEYLLDLSGFSADIIFAAANLVKTSRGINTFQAYVSAIDNINKLVYIQIANAAGSAAAAPTAGTIIAYELAFKDTFSA